MSFPVAFKFSAAFERVLAFFSSSSAALESRVSLNFWIRAEYLGTRSVSYNHLHSVFPTSLARYCVCMFFFLTPVNSLISYNMQIAGEEGV